MYPSTSNEINNSTTIDATNTVRHTTQDAAGGSSRQRTSRSLCPTPVNSSYSSSPTEGIVKL
jgi:hypothetical protein